MHNINPYAPPSNPGGEPLSVQSEHAGPSRHKWIRFAIGAYALTTILGAAIAAYDIGTIVGSGPVLLFVGAVLVVIGFRNHDLLTSLLGISSFVLAALVVVLINLVPYSPTTGYWPLLTIVSLYACVSQPLAGWLIIHRPYPNIAGGG